MNCPKCTSNRLKVMDSVHNTAEDETYRRKKCANCGFSFYTVEFEAIENARFKSEWNKYHRKGTCVTHDNTCACCGYPIPDGAKLCNTCLLNGVGIK